MQLIKNILKTKASLIHQLILIFVFSSLFVKALVTLDPDFGWHIKTGQLISEKGIFYSDPFSYTMSSYPYVDHAWLTDVFIASIYPIFGMAGLAFIAIAVFSLMGVLIFGTERVVFADNHLKKSKNFKNILFVKSGSFLMSSSLLLAIGIFMPYFSVRTQLATWVLMALLLRIVFDKAVWQKWKFVLPFVFVLWANLHGGFASGLMVLSFVLLGRNIRNRRININEFSILSFCFLGTLANPYGVGIWREVLLTLSSSSLRFRIIEWMPAFFRFNPFLIILITLSAVFVLRYRKKFFIEELSIYFLLLTQGLMSTKLIPVWTIVAVPMTTKGLAHFCHEIQSIKCATDKFIKVHKIFYFGILGMLVAWTSLSLNGAVSLSEETFYPRLAIEYLQEDIPDGEIFSEYGWGGYLIWKLPEKKVFIDGRMAIWRWDRAPKEESSVVFDDYVDLLMGKVDYTEAFENYGVNTVLWPVPKESSIYDLLQDKLDNLLVKFGKEKSKFDFLEELQEDGWNEVYKDSVAIIYTKPI